MSHNHRDNDTIPLHSTSQSDIDEIENLINSQPSTVRPAPTSLASIPISSTYPPPPPPFIPSNLPPPTNPKPTPVPSVPSTVPQLPTHSSESGGGISISGFGSPPNTLTEPVWDTVKRDLSRIVSNLKLVVFPNPNREDPGKALRDWDLWGPFFFIVFLGLTLSWSASVKKSEVFAVAFALLAAGAVILTLNVLLLGGRIIFFQSLSPCLSHIKFFILILLLIFNHTFFNKIIFSITSITFPSFSTTHSPSIYYSKIHSSKIISIKHTLSLLGYCLFPLDIGALICMLKDNVIVKMVVVTVALAWSSWAAYPFMSTAVNPRRKALALYPVLLMYVSVGFLIMAID